MKKRYPLYVHNRPEAIKQLKRIQWYFKFFQAIHLGTKCIDTLAPMASFSCGSHSIMFRAQYV
jgi:hypothetical protein